MRSSDSGRRLLRRVAGCRYGLFQRDKNRSASIAEPGTNSALWSCARSIQKPLPGVEARVQQTGFHAKNKLIALTALLVRTLLRSLGQYFILRLLRRLEAVRVHYHTN